jgi:ornithine carbamoyltransferase
MKLNLVSIFDLNAADIWSLISLSRALKKSKKANTALNGKTLGLIFEKPSTRTTVSFAVAMYKVGGFPLILDAQKLQRRRGETIKDTAVTLSKYLDGIVIRAFSHGDVAEFAKWSSIPIINGLTDREHPCQILGDLLTIVENRNIKTVADLKKLKIVFVGDGNNIANTWIAASSILGLNFTLARPAGYGPDAEILSQSLEASKKSEASLNITEDPFIASKGADVIYTDVWTSMGSESELEKRKIVFKDYQINEGLLGLAKKNSLVMHCLPANRGEEITNDVIEGKNSVIFEQVENRLHIQKAVLIKLLG